MDLVSFRTADKASFALSGVSQRLYALEAPDSSVNRGLIAVQEGIDGTVLIVPRSIHEAEAVEGTLKMLSIP